MTGALAGDLISCTLPPGVMKAAIYVQVVERQFRYLTYFVWCRYDKSPKSLRQIPEDFFHTASAPPRPHTGPPGPGHAVPGNVRWNFVPRKASRKSIRKGLL